MKWKTFLQVGKIDRTTAMMNTNQEQDYFYWSIPTANLLQQFNNTTKEKPQEYQEAGLTSTEANLRLSKYGKNIVKSKKQIDLLSLLISQFKSPIIVIFIFTSVLTKSHKTF